MSQAMWTRMGQTAVALGCAAALWTTDAAATSAGSAVDECVIQLECPGVTLRTVPDATGKFVFKNAPAGACTVSVVSPPPPPVAGAETSVAPAGSVIAPRDAASGQATGKRQHKPLRFQITVDGERGQAKAQAADEGSPSSVSVVINERRREFSGHVTLIK